MDELMLRYQDETGEWEILPDSYATIEVETEEDFEYIKAALDFYEHRDEYAKIVYSTWRLNRDGSGTCKNCRRTTPDCWDFDTFLRYCPDCGAKMSLEEKQ